MQIGSKPTFFYYSSEDLLLVETLNIDSTWINQLRKAIVHLFDDLGDHVIFRSINNAWYQLLPDLPGNRLWTPLLLQYVLKFYGKDVGAHTIQALPNQNYSILHCMIVSVDSEVQTFQDAVIAYLTEDEIPQREFSVDGLREVLIKGKMIAGNELSGSLHTALADDLRFTWSIDGKQVTIKV